MERGTARNAEKFFFDKPRLVLSVHQPIKKHFRFDTLKPILKASRAKGALKRACIIILCCLAFKSSFLDKNGWRRRSYDALAAAIY